MLRSTRTTQGVIALSSGVRVLRSGEENVTMLKDLGVEIGKHTQIDQAVLEVRIDAFAGSGIAVRRELGHCHSHRCSRKTAK